MQYIHVDVERKKGGMIVPFSVFGSVRHRRKRPTLPLFFSFTVAEARRYFYAMLPQHPGNDSSNDDVSAGSQQAEEALELAGFRNKRLLGDAC